MDKLIVSRAVESKIRRIHFYFSINVQIEIQMYYIRIHFKLKQVIHQAIKSRVKYKIA